MGETSQPRAVMQAVWKGAGVLTTLNWCARRSRSFTLPEAANGDKISAKYDNGILNVEIPKREEAKPKPMRQIAIA